MDRKYDVITLGEILLRLSTPINGRLAQGDTLMKHLGGAELNIASEIGTMRVTEQIDAMEIMGVNSANFLILPRQRELSDRGSLGRQPRRHLLL